MTLAGGWTAYQTDETEFSLEPSGDLIEHTGEFCQCDPGKRALRLPDGGAGILYIHRALDGRPANEQAETIFIDHLEGRCECEEQPNTLPPVPVGEPVKLIVLPLKSIVAGGKVLAYGTVTAAALVHLWKLIKKE